MSVTIEDIARSAANWSIEVTPVGATKIDSFAEVLAEEHHCQCHLPAGF
jgi:methylenetetrahydrofolate reductase (NADPH)